ncbi:uncharacterized protein LOC132037350 [Lycium ferocissimum]|uniref:uncharacterized protein LOC132037350 n=1 Tax=Lycium ferocissimum TaxID=112874 RepID=UPI002814BE8B|nr:uncharacterized protein LOC132037350 [Lycium ferocissimum]XP_059283834.1 uncharacterized protein LOC132037350 [Lycium ferocissimum]
MKSIGKKWKDTGFNLHHRFYKEPLTLEENVARRPSGIDPDQWIWFLQYSKDKKTQERKRSRGELWTLTHKRKDKTYMNAATKIIGEEIERMARQRKFQKLIHLHKC